MKNIYQICDDTLILTLNEELDHHMTETIRDAVDDIIICQRIRYIIIDFTERGFMDSAGIGFIMGRYKRIISYNGKIFVANLGKNLERIFRISGLNTITTQVDSTEDAIKIIEGRGN